MENLNPVPRIFTRHPLNTSAPLQNDGEMGEGKWGKQESN